MEELIISAGGTRGIIAIGCLKNIFEKYPFNNFTHYTGCSIGAIILFMLSIGYTIEDLVDIFLYINFNDFQDLKIKNFFDKCGFDDGVKFTNFIKAIIINKKYEPFITYKELYNINNKIFTVVVVNITKGIPEYHNYLTTPDLPILLSIRMTTNIPIIFSPILYNNNYYIDGGLLDPFPYLYNKNIKKKNKIGVWLFDKNEYNFITDKESIFINNINSSISYIINIIKILYLNYIKQYNNKKLLKNVLYIDFNEPVKMNIDFKLSLLEKFKMFTYGTKKSKVFLKNII